MTLTFPLGIGVLWQKIRFGFRPEFTLVQYKRQSMDGGGNLLTSKMGQPKWRADVSTAGGRHDEDMAVQAMITALLGRDGTFLAYDIRRPFPLLDPDGLVVAGATVQVLTKGANNRSLSLKGLPANYKLSAGDFISVTDGSGKRALLQLSEDIQAVGTTTAEFEVQPFLPTWLAVNQAVNLSKPLGKFRIEPGSYKPQSGTGNQSAGVSFSMISVSI